MDLFGKTANDDDLEQIQKARQIVHEIMNFGVSQKQILLIIQFLGAEIENNEQMVEVIAMAKEFLKPQKFLFTDKAEE